MEKLIKGDVIFICDDTSLLSNAIVDIYKGYDDNLFNHALIYLGDNKVGEATYNDGVIMSDLSTVLLNKYPILVCRISDKEKAFNACNEFHKYIGYPYNKFYIKDDKSFYCTSIIEQVYLDVYGFRVFREYPLKFNDKFNEISNFWKKYYDDFNMEVPIKEVGTHPAKMSLDSFFKVRFYISQD